jgi:hypothetical protein
VQDTAIASDVGHLIPVAGVYPPTNDSEQMLEEVIELSFEDILELYVTLR